MDHTKSNTTSTADKDKTKKPAFSLHFFAATDAEKAAQYKNTEDLNKYREYVINRLQGKVNEVPPSAPTFNY